jgi:hypothetical protein
MMTDRIVELILDEGKWLFASMLLASVSVVVLIRRQRSRNLPSRLVIIQAMNLFYGCMIGIMALGHLLAVTVKLAQGTLKGSLVLLYPLGLMLAVPSWWLVSKVGRLEKDEERLKREVVIFNASLVVFLLVLGPHNLPLAAPAILSVAYLLHSKGTLGWTIVGATIIACLGLLAGSLVFMYSGQTFEQFSGPE